MDFVDLGEVVSVHDCFYVGFDGVGAEVFEGFPLVKVIDITLPRFLIHRAPFLFNSESLLRVFQPSLILFAKSQFVPFRCVLRIQLNQHLIPLPQHLLCLLRGFLIKVNIYLPPAPPLSHHHLRLHPTLQKVEFHMQLHITCRLQRQVNKVLAEGVARLRHDVHFEGVLLLYAVHSVVRLFVYC